MTLLECLCIYIYLSTNVCRVDDARRCEPYSKEIWWLSGVLPTWLTCVAYRAFRNGMFCKYRKRLKFLVFFESAFTILFSLPNNVQKYARGGALLPRGPLLNLIPARWVACLSQSFTKETTWATKTYSDSNSLWALWNDFDVIIKNGSWLAGCPGKYSGSTCPQINLPDFCDTCECTRLIVVMFRVFMFRGLYQSFEANTWIPPFSSFLNTCFYACGILEHYCGPQLSKISKLNIPLRLYRAKGW